MQELDPGMLDRFEALRAFMIALGDDVQETTLRFYIAFKRIKNFACVEFRPTTGKILMFVKVDPSRSGPRSAVCPPSTRSSRRTGRWKVTRPAERSW